MVVNTEDNIELLKGSDNPTIRADARVCPTEYAATLVATGAFDPAADVDTLFDDFSFQFTSAWIVSCVTPTAYCKLMSV